MTTKCATEDCQKTAGGNGICKSCANSMRNGKRGQSRKYARDQQKPKDLALPDWEPIDRVLSEEEPLNIAGKELMI